MVFDRQLLLGIGVGLLLAATLSALDGDGGKISEMEVVTRAKALGMTFPGEQRLDLGSGSSEDAPAETKPAGLAAPPAPAAAPATTAQAVAETPPPSSAARPPAPAPAVPVRGARTVTVVVPPGATAGEVARLLRGKSLIADEGEFLRIAAGRQAEARFLPGTYRFASDVTVKALITALLTGPKAE